MGTLVGLNYSEETRKTNVWLDMDRPEIIVYEDTTARSDHASFQDNLGTVTVGFEVWLMVIGVIIKHVTH